MAPGGIAVEAHDVERRYGEGPTAVHALRGVSLDVERGQLVAVMGPSGSGKSTLMHILAGLDKPTSGTVTIAGIEITGLDDAQADAAAPRPHRLRLPVLQPAPDADRRRRTSLLPLSIAGEKPDRDWLEELLDADRPRATGATTGPPSSRAASSSASRSPARWSREPTIVFADEPTGNLDSKTSGEILELLRDSAETYDQTIVMVTHEARAAAIADRILFLADGLIVKELTDAELGRGARGDEHAGVSDQGRRSPDCSGASSAPC